MVETKLLKTREQINIREKLWSKSKTMEPVDLLPQFETFDHIILNFNHSFDHGSRSLK